MNDDPKKPSLVSKCGASLIAGFTAAAFSLPFDMIKSRLQNGGDKYKGVLDASTQILKNVNNNFIINIY
jgi:solute carrier family 25 oxoglutarate transporter 11